jgi:hypothetical protein
VRRTWIYQKETPRMPSYDRQAPGACGRALERDTWTHQLLITLRARDRR